MSKLSFGEAIDLALAHRMALDERIIVWGEDVPLIRRQLMVRFGAERVLGTPISESAFLGAGVGAALGGLRPVVEIMLVDFITVALNGLVNEAGKIATFSNGTWTVPLVVRTTCGGGYGDGGQHSQALWGLLAGVPGLAVVVPSNPADAAGLMLTALDHDGPVVFLEHKLLSEVWLEWLGGSRRSAVHFDVPSAGARGHVDDPPTPVPLGSAAVLRDGTDLGIVSLGVGVHRSLAAADELSGEGVSAAVVDLRTVAPLDRSVLVDLAKQTGRILVVDEDYLYFGLSGEIAAVLAESGVEATFARVGVEGTLPYDRDREAEALPNPRRIVRTAKSLLGKG